MFRDDYKAVKNYMRKKRVPMSFQIKIHYYLQYAIDQETSLNSSHDVIYKYLSKTFRDSLLYETIGSNLFSTIMFEGFTEEFKASIISRITEKIFSPHDIIFLVNSFFIFKSSRKMMFQTFHITISIKDQLESI
jgi:hypothetical protein